SSRSTVRRQPTCPLSPYTTLFRSRAAGEQRDAAADEALHDDLAGVGADAGGGEAGGQQGDRERQRGSAADQPGDSGVGGLDRAEDRKSTRLNSSHDQISYAVFCLK